MQSFHYRVYTGPTGVGQIANQLRAQAMPWQQVTIEGTEHVHVAIAALYRDAADREIEQWFDRAGLSALLRPSRLPSVEFLRAESLAQPTA